MSKNYTPSENAILIVLTAPPNAQGATRWPMQKGRMILGRQASCDIHLPDRQVSREHARVFHTSNGYWIEDLGSKNGTHVNGKLLEGPAQLKDGDMLQIGLAYRLSFVDTGGTVPLTFDAQKAFALRLDIDKKQVWIGGQTLTPPLSPAQFDLLQLLFDAQGSIVDRDAIANKVWGSTLGVTEQAIDALIRRLRRRLGEVEPDKEFIVTVRGYGFRLEMSSDE